MLDMIEPIGSQLKQLRELRGLTQTALAREAGVDQGYVSKIESGEREPTLDVLEKLLDVLGAGLYIELREGGLGEHSQSPARGSA